MFDLDGTLTDSRDGVVRCIQHALARVGGAAVQADALTRYVGPPLAGSFAVLLGTSDAALIDRAIAAYRDRFERTGMFENAVFPGIEEALAELDAAGHDLRVVTAKPRPYARRILGHFGLARHFRAIHAPDLGARHYTKGALIREACAMPGTVTEGAVMIGDRADDIVGARENGLGAVGVTWGYGERGELEAARPDHLVGAIDELVTCLRGA